MASEPTEPTAASSPSGEPNAVLPEVLAALGSVAVASLIDALTSVRSPTPPGELDRFELERLRRATREQTWRLERQQRELEQLRQAALASETEAEQLRRAARAGAKDAEHLRRLRGRLVRSSGGPLDQEAELRTYAWCRQFRLFPGTRPPTSRALRAQYLRVSRMSLVFGEALDAAGIAFRWIRYVAYGQGMFEQKVRTGQVLAGCRPPRPLRVRALSAEVHRALLVVDLDEVPALVRSLIEEGKGDVFVGR